jgi:hypothetical protein
MDRTEIVRESTHYFQLFIIRSSVNIIVKFPVAKRNFSRKRKLCITDLLGVKGKGHVALNKTR